MKKSKDLLITAYIPKKYKILAGIIFLGLLILNPIIAIVIALLIGFFLMEFWD